MLLTSFIWDVMDIFFSEQSMRGKKVFSNKKFGNRIPSHRTTRIEMRNHSQNGKVINDKINMFHVH